MAVFARIEEVDTPRRALHQAREAFGARGAQYFPLGADRSHLTGSSLIERDHACGALAGHGNTSLVTEKQYFAETSSGQRKPKTATFLRRLVRRREVEEITILHQCSHYDRWEGLSANAIVSCEANAVGGAPLAPREIAVAV